MQLAWFALYFHRDELEPKLLEVAQLPLGFLKDICAHNRRLMVPCSGILNYWPIPLFQTAQHYGTKPGWSPGHKEDALRKILLVVFVCGLVAAFAPSLQAAPFGQAFTGAALGSQLGNGPYTLGWSFDVSAPISVTGLAVYHDNGAGLLENHDVGIWDAAGNLIVSATVTAADPCLADQLGFQTWCTVGVHANLGPGTYTIGAVWNSLLDDMIFPGTLAAEGIANVNGANVSFIQNEFVAGGVLTDPTNTTGDTMSYFGPNFMYGGSTVPEPGTLVLLGSGLLGAVGVIRRKINL